MSALPPLRPSRLQALLRASAAALVLLCLVAQPVVALAHELHEAQHPAAAAGQAHTSESAPDGDDHAAGTLDALLHTMDCCAHGTVALVTPFHWTFQPARVVHAPALASPAPCQPAARHLRPPIPA